MMTIQLSGLVGSLASSYRSKRLRKKICFSHVLESKAHEAVESSNFGMQHNFFITYCWESKAELILGETKCRDFIEKGPWSFFYVICRFLGSIFVEIGHEILSMAILPLQSIQEGQWSVMEKCICTLYW